MSGAGEREGGKRKQKQETPDQRALERDRKLAAMVQEHNVRIRLVCVCERERETITWKTSLISIVGA